MYYSCWTQGFLHKWNLILQHLGKRDKTKSGPLSLLQRNCILQQPNIIAKFSMSYCCILENFLLQDVMAVALVTLIFLTFLIHLPQLSGELTRRRFRLF